MAGAEVLTELTGALILKVDRNCRRLLYMACGTAHKRHGAFSNVLSLMGVRINNLVNEKQKQNA